LRTDLILTLWGYISYKYEHLAFDLSQLSSKNSAPQTTAVATLGGLPEFSANRVIKVAGYLEPKGKGHQGGAEKIKEGEHYLAKLVPQEDSEIKSLTNQFK